MKSLLAIALMGFSLSAMACPTITGSFFDADSETTKIITQDGCTSSTWSEEGDVTTLYADNVERILQQEGSMTAFAKVSFTATELVIDIRMDYGGHNDFDLPVRWITSYRIDKYNNLVERIEPFKADGSQGATEYVTFRRVK